MKQKKLHGSTLVAEKLRRSQEPVITGRGPAVFPRTRELVPDKIPLGGFTAHGPALSEKACFCTASPSTICDSIEIWLYDSTGYGYYNYRHPKINTVNITLTKPLTDNRRPIKIVAVSDIHLGNGTGKTSLKQYVKMINGQNPDLILIGGDLIDNSVIPLYAENMAEELTELKAPLGIYMVPGNHEYISGIDKSIQFIQNTPIQLLRDSVVTLPCGIQLIGRDDRSNARRLPLQKLMARIDKSKPVILLDHQPYQLAESQAAGIDLQFSGHTHHGQVWPMNWVTDHLYEQSHGYRQWENSHIYVSSGLSLWGPPFRIGTESEMVVLQLH